MPLSNFLLSINNFLLSRLWRAFFQSRLLWLLKIELFFLAFNFYHPSWIPHPSTLINIPSESKLSDPLEPFLPLFFINLHSFLKPLPLMSKIRIRLQTEEDLEVNLLSVGVVCAYDPPLFVTIFSPYTRWNLSQILKGKQFELLKIFENRRKTCWLTLQSGGSLHLDQDFYLVVPPSSKIFHDS